MCQTCWNDAERPAIVTETTQATAALICRLYDMPAGGAGGHLHIVVDDWNVDADADYGDGFLDACERDIAAEEAGELAGTRGNPDFRDPDLITLERRILAALRPMTNAERLSTLALADAHMDPRGWASEIAAAPPAFQQAVMAQRAEDVF